MILTTAEAIAILNKHLGVEVKISDEDSADWIVNAKKTPGRPVSLDADTYVDVICNNGDRLYFRRASAMAREWNTYDPRSYHITKYRVRKLTTVL